jgi:hypothetical protein
LKYGVLYGHPHWEASWNDGIVEFWNTGYKKRKKSNIEKILILQTHITLSQEP